MWVVPVQKAKARLLRECGPWSCELAHIQSRRNMNSCHLGCGYIWIQVCVLPCPNEHGPTSVGSKVNSDPNCSLGFPRPYSQRSRWSLKANAGTAGYWNKPPCKDNNRCNESIPLLGSWQLFLLMRFISSVKPFLRRALL